ncbi:GNAT family N-acetyltransferase [Candidatus Uhrbacteria bacterium]|nr:GNAT family N-acetyltransferase [Candidatus Uhrbacteria bacterium]
MDRPIGEVLIRYARSNDVAACIRLSKCSWPGWWANNTQQGSRHIRECIRGRRCLVAVSNREVIAYLVWGTLWNKIHLQDVFVQAPLRRHGVARALVEHVIAIAKRQGYREIMSDCDTINKPSIALHRRMGFGRCGRITKNWDNDDSYVFSKKI